MEDYKKLVDYFKPTLNEADKDFENLVKLPCKSDKKLSLAGLRTLNHFFIQHKLSIIPKKGNKSLYQMFKDKDINSFVAQHPKVEDNKYDNIYALFRLYRGSFSEFRPALAKFIYCSLKPKRILDLEANLGGKCLGALAFGVPYIGICNHRQLKPAYEDMVARYNVDKVDMSMIWKSALDVDMSKIDYDLAICYPLEPDYRYPDDKDTYEDFIRDYLGKILEQAFNNLSKDGNLVVICRDRYINDVVKANYLPRPVMKVSEPLHDRFESQLSKIRPENRLVITTFNRTRAVK